MNVRNCANKQKKLMNELKAEDVYVKTTIFINGHTIFIEGKSDSVAKAIKKLSEKKTVKEKYYPYHCGYEYP